MKIIFYGLWGVYSLILLLAIIFNHYAEFYLEPQYVELLFNVHNKDWAYINIMITSVWLIFTWIGLYIYLKKDGQ